MQKQSSALNPALVRWVKIKAIRKANNEDVYCLGTSKNGTMIANGVITKQCDALRYAVYSAFPQGEFSHPDENISHDQLRRRVFNENDIYGQFNSELGF